MLSRTTLLAPLMVAAVACSGSGRPAGHGAPESSRPPSPQPSGASAPGTTATPAAADIAMPLDAYVDGAAGRVVANATEVLIAECMRRKGFTYHADLTAGTETTSQRTGDFGLTDAKLAATEGYPSGAKRAEALIRSATKRPSDAYLMALQGFVHPDLTQSHPPGCQDEAFEQLRSDDLKRVDFELVGRLGLEAKQRAAADRRVLDATRAWSQCMKDAGFSYATPVDAMNAGWPRDPTAREIATATTDVRCKEKSDLVRMWLTAEATYQAELVAQNEEALAEIKRLNAERIRRAEAILAAHQ
jgi:hypothetical protein